MDRVIELICQTEGFAYIWGETRELGMLDCEHERGWKEVPFNKASSAGYYEEVNREFIGTQYKKFIM